MNWPSENSAAQAAVNCHDNLPKGEGATNTMPQKNR